MDDDAAVEGIAEDFQTEDFFKPGWETLEAKTSFFAPYMQRMRDDGYIMREARSPAAARMRVAHPQVGEHEVLMFGSNNYLGLANEPAVVERTIAAVREFGAGCGGPPLLNGTTSLHRALEERLAAMKRTEDAVLYSSGFAANLGWCSALLSRQDILIYDALSHASLIDGMRLGHFQSEPFAHNNVDDLRKRLMKVRYKAPYRNIIVSVEGVYSMEGDVVPLPEVRALCTKYNAWLAIDDAHGTGVLGAKGHGTPEHFGLEGQLELVMGTFSKTFGVVGGFVAASRDVCDFLRFFSRSYMFSASLPQPTVAAVLAGLEFLEAHPERVAALHANVRYFVERLTSLGIKTRCQTAIIPILVPERVPIRKLVARLHEEGLFVNGVSYPVIPRNLQRLRLSMMATFTRADLDEAAETLARVFREFGMLE